MDPDGGAWDKQILIFIPVAFKKCKSSNGFWKFLITLWLSKSLTINCQNLIQDFISTNLFLT